MKLPYLHHWNPTPPLPLCSFCCLVSFTEWVITPHFMCYFTYWYYGSTMSNLSTLVPEGPCCVFHAKRCQGYWVWQILWFLLAFYFDITHPHIKTHSWTNRLTHPYKYILTPPVMCSQQLFVLHWLNNSLISKTYYPKWLCYSKISHLQNSYICWLDS